MSTRVETIFDLDDVLEISSNRHKEDILKVSAVSGNDSLSKSGEIRFEINNQQHYICFSESYLVCEFSMTKGDGTALGNDDITLENNWFPRCFNQMTLNIGGREVEGIHQAPGEMSTIANLIMTSDSYRNVHGQLSGWFPDSGKGDTDVADIDYNAGYYWRKRVYNDKKRMTVVFPLKYLFGFCEYTKILYLIKISLSLIRKDDAIISNDVFYGAAGTTGKLKFEKLELHIPYIEPSLQIEELITKRLNTKNPIDVVFLKRSANQITIPTGATHSWKLGNYTNSVRFVFIAFKTTGAPSPQTNNALFTEHNGNDKITALRLQLNNVYYPIDRMQFNFSDYRLNEPYKAYIDCAMTFGNEPQLTLQEFHGLCPIFIFNCSAQPETLKNNGIDLTLHIEKSSGLTLEAYCLLLEDAHYTIDVSDGKMLRLS